MIGQWKIAVQNVIRRAGYQLRRLEPNTSLENPYVEQQRLVPDARMIFEVGAADGRDCEYYRQLFPRSIVHAFEPLPENFKSLAARSAIDQNIIAHEAALADTKGTAAFHVGAWADSSSLLKAKNTGSTFDAYQASTGTIEVRTDTLDSVASMYGVTRIDILKMDAQGAELTILRGAAKLLKARAIQLIYTEAQFRPLYEGAGTFAEIATYLGENGFQLHNLYNINHNQHGIACWCDALFVLNDANEDQ
jgi:FkbM family methyltransferase